MSNKQNPKEVKSSKICDMKRTDDFTAARTTEPQRKNKRAYNPLLTFLTMLDQKHVIDMEYIIDCTYQISLPIGHF